MRWYGCVTWTWAVRPLPAVARLALERERPGTLRRPHPPASLASCRGGSALWSFDDRGTGPTRLSTEPRHALPHPARAGKEGIPSIHRAASRTYRTKDVPDYAER